MKTWIKTSIAAALIATGALGTTVMAGGGNCDGPMGGKAGWHRMAPEQMKANMTQRAEVHLARLELALALTPEQKPAWDAFKGSMKERAERMAAQMESRSQGERPTTAIERLQRMEEMSALRQAEMGDTRKSVEAFYTKLSEAQKTVFDDEFSKMQGRHGGMGRHGMGKHGMESGARGGMRDGGGMGRG